MNFEATEQYSPGCGIVYYTGLHLQSVDEILKNENSNESNCAAFSCGTLLKRSKVGFCVWTRAIWPRPRV